MFEINLSQGGDRLSSLIRDLKRAVANKKYEHDGAMLRIGADVNLAIGGVFSSFIQRHARVQKAIDSGDPALVARLREEVRQLGFHRTREGYFSDQFSLDHNLIPNAGINFILDVIYGSTSKISTWYQGLFTSNSTPAAGWTSAWAGASSGPVATELPDASYDESGRQAAVFGSATSKKISTSTPTTFTLATGTSGITIYGSTLNESATVAYNSTDKKLVAATTFANAKSGLGAADVINVSYEITGSST